MAYATPASRGVIVAAHPYASASAYRAGAVYTPQADASAYRAAAYAPHPHPDVRIYAADAFVREQYFNHQYPHYGEQQTATLGVNDTVATTTRSVVGGAHHHHTSVAGSSTAPQLPENAIYYMGMSSGVNYISDPYVGGYADATYRPGAAYTSYPTGTFYGPSHGYNQQYGTSYMHYPQPSPPNRRSRTAPSRTLPRGASGAAPVAAAPPPGAYPTTARRPRGASVDAVAYRAYLAPGKRPPAAYAANRRSRASYHEASGTMPAGYMTGPTVTDHYPSYHTVARPINRTPSIYQPSYTSYPPAQMQFKERAAKEADPNRYGLAWRCIVKGAQLLLGAAILGLVLGPMRATSLVDFVTTTRTEWQGVVVGIVGTMTIVTLLLLVSAIFMHKNGGWRKVDAHASIVGFILYLLAACIESYYAACYPPNGPRLNLVCHRPEWIIATILCFINVILYVIDFILAWMAGVSML